MQDLHALFTGEDDTWEAWLVFDTGPKLGSNTIKLRRGFPTSQSASTNPSQVAYHVAVFLCHYISSVFGICKSMLLFLFFYSKRELKS